MFLTSYALPFWLAVGLVFGGEILLMPLINLYILHPIFDLLITKYVPSVSKGNFFKQGQKSDSLSYVMLHLYPVFQLAIIIGCLYCVIELPFNSSEFWMIVMAAGIVTGGAGLTMAHELMHKRSGLARFGALALTWMCSYAHWNIEHVLGHHKNVGTFEDPATSRKNENLYRFVVRSAVMQVVSAFKLQRDSFLLYWGVQFVIYGTIFALTGTAGIIFFLAQSLLAIFLLEHVNYIEHYGLERKKLPNGRYEKVRTAHSWDCYSLLTNVSMFNLGFHADHHAHVNKDYRELASQENAKAMPYGITVQMLMAMIPSLWFRKMNPLLVDEKQALNFTADLIPEIKTAVFESFYPDLRESVINQNLFRYLKFTQVLETEVINRFVGELLEQKTDHELLKDIKISKSVKLLDRAKKIFEEEVEHAESVTALLVDAKRRTEQESYALSGPSSLNYLLETLQDIVNPRLRALTLFGFVYVSETLISEKLSRLSKDKTLYPPVRRFMQHHLKDEVKHSQFFGEFIQELWPTLIQPEQFYLEQRITEYKRLFLSPDSNAIAAELNSLGVTPEHVVAITAEVTADALARSLDEETKASDRYLNIIRKTESLAAREQG